MGCSAGGSVGDPKWGPPHTDDLNTSQLPHDHSNIPVTARQVLPERDPYLGLLPKQFVLGGWCLVSAAAATLLGSRPGTWDPECVGKKKVGEEND